MNGVNYDGTGDVIMVNNVDTFNIDTFDFSGITWGSMTNINILNINSMQPAGILQKMTFDYNGSSLMGMSKAIVLNLTPSNKSTFQFTDVTCNNCVESFVKMIGMWSSDTVNNSNVEFNNITIN
jgi:hypothetical protein